jgi:hypothetical protein
MQADLCPEHGAVARAILAAAHPRDGAKLRQAMKCGALYLPIRAGSRAFFHKIDIVFREEFLMANRACESGSASSTFSGDVAEPTTVIPSRSLLRVDPSISEDGVNRRDLRGPVGAPFLE